VLNTDRLRGGSHFAAAHPWKVTVGAGAVFNLFIQDVSTFTAGHGGDHVAGASIGVCGC
jgi:hypothetical protein